MATRATYLDWNANAPMRPEAARAISEALSLCGNPTSVHAYGRRMRHAFNEAREAVARLVNAAPEELIFTSGGTEANNLALQAFPNHRRIVSAIEHASVLAAAPEATQLPVNSDGVVALDVLEHMLASERYPTLVSVMLANNETGALQPTVDAAHLAHRYGALFHCDAVQGPGQVPVDFRVIGADMMTLSAHKTGGPMGVGALVARNGLSPFQPLIKGGGQERNRRGGTENFLGIVGFGAAANLALSESSAYRGVAKLRDEAERRLLEIAPDATIFARMASRLPNTLNIAMPRVAAATQVIALDLAGVMVSAGSACSSGKVTRSHVLDAMGVARETAECAIRISLGWSTGAADIDHLVEAWGALYARTRASAA